jgi:hypothetical protein
MNKFIAISTLLSSILMAEGSGYISQEFVDTSVEKVERFYSSIEKDIEYKGNIGVETAYLRHDMKGKRDNQSAIRFEADGKYQFKENQKFVAKVKALYDTNDNKRRYFDINDLYFQHDFEDYNFLIGKSTRFWGAMEFYNQSDTFNTKDWLDNPFDYESKIGAWNIAYTRFFDDSELSIIVKLHEEKQAMQERRSVYNFLPTAYDKKLDTDSDNEPTIYLKYSSSIDKYQVDYSLIYQNGYDEQRYMVQKTSRDTNISSMQQHAYNVNKFIGFGTMVRGDTLYKTELAYTSSHDDKVADYAQGSIGLEHTLYGIWNKMDVGIIAEYYKYKLFQNHRFNAKSFGKLFDDDLSLGFRLSLNDISSSEVLGGWDIDRHNREQLFFVEYDTRIEDKYKLGVSYQHLTPKEDSSFEKLDSVMVEFGYYF